MKIIDDAAPECGSSAVIAGKLGRCNGTSREYVVGGRQTSSRCLVKGCGHVAREDVTICHAKTKWNAESLRAWWTTVRG